MKIKSAEIVFDPKAVEGSGKTGEITTTVAKLEKLFKRHIPYYKDEDYSDDEYKTDYAIAGYFNDTPFALWNYKNGHYAGIIIEKTDAVDFSLTGTPEFVKWLKKNLG